MLDIPAINSILQSFGINAKCVDSKRVRHVCFYDLVLAPITRVKQIESYSAEISLALKAKAPISIKVLPELGIVRLEVVCSDPEILPLFDHLGKQYDRNAVFPVFLGCSTDGQNICMDIAENPHMLVGGATGSGKSTLLHTIIANALIKPNTLIQIIDTKAVEYNAYRKYDNVHIANDYDTALGMLDWAYNIMQLRYRAMNGGLVSFGTEDSPHILFVIDEFADLVAGDKKGVLVERLCQVVQKCRAAGIYFIVATQRPSVRVIPGVVKANLPARLACKVASGVDSRVILDREGAQGLLGKGDAILNNDAYSYTRFQIAYTTPSEIVEKI